MLTHLLLRITFVGAEWVLWILVAASFLSVTIIVERFLYFRRNKVDANILGPELYEQLRAGRLNAARQLVVESKAIECVVVAAGLAAAERGSQACTEAMLSAKARERTKLDANLAILGTLGNNAPFIGLLGTVLGIIKAAHDLAPGAGGTGDPGAVMAGVFEALVATAVGLFVALPAVMSFNFFQRKVKATVLQVDSLAHLVLASLRFEKRAPAAATATAAAAQAAQAQKPGLAAAGR